jgi:glucose/arabinose dehydrogenase
MTGPGRRRIVLAAVLALTTILCLRPSLPGPSIVEAAVTVPAGFSDSTFVSGLGSPTAMAFAPDGRIFVAQQSGELRVVKNGALLATPFVSLTVDS